MIRLKPFMDFVKLQAFANNPWKLIYSLITLVLMSPEYSLDSINTQSRIGKWSRIAKDNFHDWMKTLDLTSSIIQKSDPFRKREKKGNADSKTKNCKAQILALKHFLCKLIWSVIRPWVSMFNILLWMIFQFCLKCSNSNLENARKFPGTTCYCCMLNVK